MGLILSNDEIVKMAPSAGAVAPYEKASERYSFVSTLKAVDILRGVGWMPIIANESSVRNPERQGYQKHIIRFIKEGLSYNGERVDLILTNSHDCGTAFQISASVWRKWRALHLRHYVERYKMVRDDSKPTKQWLHLSIRSPFYH